MEYTTAWWGSGRGEELTSNFAPQKLAYVMCSVLTPSWPANWSVQRWRHGAVVGYLRQVELMQYDRVDLGLWWWQMKQLYRSSQGSNLLWSMQERMKGTGEVTPKYTQASFSVKTSENCLPYWTKHYAVGARENLDSWQTCSKYWCE